MRLIHFWRQPVEHTYGCAFEQRGGVCDCGAAHQNSQCGLACGHSGQCVPPGTLRRALLRWLLR